MRKSHGYGLDLNTDDYTLLKVSPGKEKKYRLEWIKEFSSIPGGESSRLPDAPGGNLVLTLPGADVSLMTVMLPEMKSRMLANALKGLIAKEKGGGIDDWIIDYTIAGKKGTGIQSGQKKRITAVGAARETIEGQFDKAEKMGLVPIAMMPGYLALEQLFRVNEPALSEDGGWILVFMGKTERFLCAGDSETLLLARILPGDLSGGTEEEEYIGKIAVEIERSAFFARQKEDSVEINRVIICGEPRSADSLVTRMAETGGMEIIRWKPEELFETDGPGRWENTLSLAAAAAVIESPSYSLLPMRAVVGKNDFLRRYAIVTVSALAASVAPILFIGGIWTAGVQEEFLARAGGDMDFLTERVDASAESYLHNRALKTCLSNIEGIGRGQSWLAGVMREIALGAPDAITFEKMKIDRDAGEKYQLILKGRSVASDGELAQLSFLRFLQSLDSNPRLQRKREPSWLEISGIEEDEIVRSRVAFTVEYYILEDRE
ncbi:MAG: hypothetical protein JW814_06425 [Candidatus Krumholzibacteriota bacterium]|nr:hypothetical protein [Candidatus Krumholzibacteriota bacterium]